MCVCVCSASTMGSFEPLLNTCLAVQKSDGGEEEEIGPGFAHVLLESNPNPLLKSRPSFRLVRPRVLIACWLKGRMRTVHLCARGGLV